MSVLIYNILYILVATIVSSTSIFFVYNRLMKWGNTELAFKIAISFPILVVFTINLAIHLTYTPFALVMGVGM